MRCLTIAERLAEFVYSVGFDQLPPDVVAQAKLSILDTLGVAIRGSEQTSTRIVRDLVLRQETVEESTLAGTGERVSVLGAAFVNGTSAHSLELDDHISHKRSLGHPGVVNVPPGLALGEARRASGRDVLTAIVHGYEVTSRLNDVIPVGFDNFGRGFHGTAITGTFGAAAVTGKLLGTEPGRLADAFGISGTMTAGSFEYNASGAWTKRLHAGHSGRNGVLAGLLAHEGYTGPHTAIEGRHGFFNSYFGEGNYDEGKVLEDLGQDWALRHMMYKPFACAGILHSPMAAMQAVMTENALNHRDIAHVVVHTSSTIEREMTQPRDHKVSPQTVVDAQFSLPFAVAVMAVRGRALLDEFSEACIHDPDVREFVPKISWCVNDEIERVWPGEEPSRVDVELRNGQRLSASVPGPKGSLQVPMAEAELREKFRSITAPVVGIGNADELLSVVDNLEDVEDLQLLTTLLR